MSKNVELKTGYTQVCVWPGTTLDHRGPGAFEDYMLSQFQVKVQYLENILTTPNTDNDGNPVEGTGGRSDLFFAVEQDGLTPTFCVGRLYYGIRWIEDVLSECNYTSRIYPERIFDYCSWGEKP